MPPNISNTSWQISASDIRETAERAANSTSYSLQTSEIQDLRSGLNDSWEFEIVDGDDGFRVKATRKDEIQHEMSPISEPTVELWYCNNIDTPGVTEVAEAFAGDANEWNGWEGVRELFVPIAREEIEYLISETGRKPSYAFNDATGDWPHRVRAYIAGREAEQGTGDIRTEEYIEQTEEFARSCGMAEVEPMQTELDTHFAANPFDDDLTTNEVKSVLFARGAEDEVPDDLLERIDDHTDFRKNLLKYGSVTAALLSEQFDNSVPMEIIKHCAPPDEWDELNPDNVEKRGCYYCGTSYYHIVNSDGEQEWRSDLGETTRKLHTENNTESIHYTEHTTLDARAGGVCGECIDEMASRGTQYCFIDSDTERFTGVYDSGVLYENDHDGLPGSADYDVFLDMFGSPSGIIVEPGDGGTNPVAVRNEIDLLVEGEELAYEIEQGPLFFERMSRMSDDYRAMRVPVDEPQAGAEGKHLFQQVSEDAT